MIRKDRKGIIRLPGTDDVKKERESDIIDKQEDLTPLAKAKAVLGFRRFNCWLCYKDTGNFAWSQAKLNEYAGLFESLDLKFFNVKEQRCVKHTYQV